MSTLISTMREAQVAKDTTVSIYEIPIPQPLEPHSILVRVHVCGINPKDWKMPAGILTSVRWGLLLRLDDPDTKR